MTDYEPCGLGVCAANAGHEGTCVEASGWVEETPMDLVKEARDEFLPHSEEIWARNLVSALADAVEALERRAVHAELEWSEASARADALQAQLDAMTTETRPGHRIERRLIGPWVEVSE